MKRLLNTLGTTRGLFIWIVVFLTLWLGLWLLLLPVLGVPVYSA